VYAYQLGGVRVSFRGYTTITGLFQSTQFNQDLQIECVAKPASSQLIELIESWRSIQLNIEASLNDLQP
jgi:hypothetical protein